MRALIFILFYALLFFGDSAMADDGRRSRLATVGASDPAMTQQTSRQEQDLDALVDRVLRGEISFEDAMNQHRQQYFGGRPPDWSGGSQNQNLLRRPNQ